ncbi:site-specific integrase [Algibacter lectus]|uniref:site-specific integrase n=1 Tax=Algibacter lectus TaxID=221126 RepID=UPI0026F346BA|nr:site-specific integrase [Algibacter lectus]MDO7138910.1 site-specific integrase [Algibacter lectus]
MASIKVILRINKIDKSGKSPLYLRVIKDRKTKFISLSLKISENEWDSDKQIVKKNHSNSTRLNKYISQKIADAQGQIADLETKNLSASARRLKEAIKGKPNVNFFEYSYDRCEKQKHTLALSTYNNYKNYLKKFENYIGNKDMTFDDITVTTLKNYAGYCSTTLGNNNTTINFSLKILGLMFKEAQREDLVPLSHFPFSKFSVKKSKSTKRFLSAKQLEAFMKLDVSGKSKAEVIKDMFIFSVFSGGLRFGDIIELKWENYNSKEHKITKVIRKTNRQHSVRIGKVAIDILKKYKKSNSIDSDIIFPFTNIDKEYFTNREQRSKVVRKAIALSCMHLTKMGKRLELPFSLTFHISRHTFATRALNNGMRIEHVSKLMDHSDIGITQVYAKIISSELDNAVDKYIN